METSAEYENEVQYSLCKAARWVSHVGHQLSGERRYRKRYENDELGMRTKTGPVVEHETTAITCRMHNMTETLASRSQIIFITSRAALFCPRYNRAIRSAGKPVKTEIQ